MQAPLFALLADIDKAFESNSGLANSPAGRKQINVRRLAGGAAKIQKIPLAVTL